MVVDRIAIRVAVGIVVALICELPNGREDKRKMIDFEKIRNDILLYSPWLARVLLSLPVYKDNTCQSAGTDGTKIVYNSSWFETLPHNEKLGVIVHECLHVLLGHHVRPGSREPARWNIAADYELNPHVLAAGYDLPADALLPPSAWAGKEAEWIYERLPEGGQQWDYLQAADCETVADKEAAVQAWKELIGGMDKKDLPSGIARALAEKIIPRRTVADAIVVHLATALDDSAETWAPCSRRWRYLPSQPERPAGYVIVVVDTSGSMTDATVRNCLSEVLGIAAIGRVDVIYADAAIAAIHEDIHVSNLPLPKGGGGTDFRPALKEIARRGPDIAVYLTDGEGIYGLLQPGIVWASPVRPPWGEWINLSNLTKE